MTGIGVDIVELHRLNIHNHHFVKRILSDEEYKVFCDLNNDRRKLEYLGGRFAGKEAFLKALKKGIGEIPFKDISILNDETGAPYLNYTNAFISISHEHEYVVAFVVIQ